VPRTRPPYPDDFRREAIELARISSKSQREIEEDLGISDVTLRNWVKQAERDEGKRPDGLSSDEREELHRLRREVQTLRMEREILKKAAAFFARETGERAVGAIFSLIEAEKANYPVSVMCRALGVNRTGFHDWERRAPSDRALSDAWLTEKIKEIHATSDGTYGARRVHAELRLKHGVRVGRKRIERLMKTAGISGVLPRKRRRTTVRLPGLRVAPDLVERDFRPDGPNLTWSAGHHLHLDPGRGSCTSAHVQDLFSRLIVGWSMADHLRADLVVSALEMALYRRRPAPGLIHHSDQGSHRLG
jgi:transposase-like protein